MIQIEVLDLFSAAAGGWSLGLHRAGFTTVAACEAVDWRRALYQQNNPGVRIYDDVRTLTAARIRADLGRLPSIVVGSPPCQDISSANTKGQGVEGARSGLFFEAIRIIGEVRPRWFALENSANLRTRGADSVLAALEALGYTCWPLVVRASDIGANHERPRIWIIGCDLAQIAHPHGYGQHAQSVDGKMAELSGLEPDRSGQARDTAQTCGSTSHAASERHVARTRNVESPRREEYGNGPENLPAPSGTGATPDADQAGQADGCLEPRLRQAQVANDGRCDGRSDDRQGQRQMAICAHDRAGPATGEPLWSLDDLASRLWLDDGLPSRVARTRAAVGGPRGTSAASLIVEAYGDALVPQIPEAIGRAILRVERAMLDLLA